MKISIRLKLNKDRRLNSGRYPLVFQIIHRRQRRLIYTGFKVMEESFNEIKQRVISNPKERFKKGELKSMNDKISAIKRSIDSMINFMTMTNETFSTEELANLYHRKQYNRYVATFTEHLIDSYIATHKFGTAKNYRYTINTLRGFASGEMLKFEDMDYQFLKNYIQYLQKRELKPNSIAFYTRNLRAIYNKAVEEGVLELPAGGSPFDKIVTKMSNTVKRALPTDTIRAILKLDLSGQKELEFSRDLFMFSFYTRGMSFVDMVNLKRDNIENNVIYYFRAKTRTLIKVGITEQLQAIIDKYRSESCYLLPCLSEKNTRQQNYTRYRTILAWHNRCLKDIASMMGLNSSLTTYVARHSWATTAKEKGVSIAVISESLGHSTESITNVYLKSFDQNVLDEANENVVLL